MGKKEKRNTFLLITAQRNYQHSVGLPATLYTGSTAAIHTAHTRDHEVGQEVPLSTCFIVYVLPLKPLYSVASFSIYLLYISLFLRRKTLKRNTKKRRKISLKFSYDKY